MGVRKLEITVLKSYDFVEDRIMIRFKIMADRVEYMTEAMNFEDLCQPLQQLLMDADEAHLWRDA